MNVAVPDVIERRSIRYRTSSVAGTSARISVRPLPAGRPLPPDADAVVLLAPVTFADVLAVHAAGRRMPRKATYFTPKPRSGLVLADI